MRILLTPPTMTSRRLCVNTNVNADVRYNGRKTPVMTTKVLAHKKKWRSNTRNALRMDNLGNCRDGLD